VGAVLTQNTAWTNVETALARLRQEGVRLPRNLLSLSHASLARMVRSSGYFNQKAKKLRSLAARFAARGALGPRGVPTREGLLAEWGVGPETADSILLYAFQVPVFVVDAYTRRIASRIGLIRGAESYDDIQSVFHSALEPSAALFNEYHALIVEHAKAHCRTRPLCAGCPVTRCRHGRLHRA